MNEPGIEGGELTRMAVLALIGQRGPTSRAVLGRELDLSSATVSQVTKWLIERGVLEPLDFEPSIGGRPAQLLGLVATAGHAVGVKVAADHLAIVDVRLDGQVVNARNEAFDVMAPDALVCLAQSLRSFIGTSEPPLLGIGVGVPGIVTRPDVGTVDAAVLNWVDMPVGRQLRKELDTPILVENDVKALAIAERLYGRGRTRRNFVVITVGRGVGFASVADGVLRRGASGGAGEIAHAVLNATGPVCACGSRGCLEAYVGAEGLVTAGRVAGVLRGREGLDHLVEAADKGNGEASAVFSRAAQRLARAVATTIAALDPEVVLVAGEGTASWRHWDGPFRSSLAKHLPTSMRELPVEVDSWEDTSWARGAAAIVLATPFDRDALAGRQRSHVLARLHGSRNGIDDELG
ncbi:MAG: ROK family protein [Acidimicrobiales bacterium]